MKSHGIFQITILLSPDCHEEGEIEMPVYHFVGGVDKEQWYMVLSRRQLIAIIPIFLSVYGRHGGWKVDHLIQDLITCYLVPSIIISEGTPVYCNRDAEYCLVPEEWNPVQNNPKQILVFSKFGGPLAL